MLSVSEAPRKQQARREGGKGGSFPWPRDVLGAPPSFRNTEKGVSDGFFLTSNMHKIHSEFRTRWKSLLTTLPQTPSRMMRGHPSHVSSLSTPHTYGNCDRAPREWFPGPRCRSRRAWKTDTSSSKCGIIRR